MRRELVKKENGYSFWCFTQGNSQWWNITPEHADPPTSGYVSKEYIERVKKQTFDSKPYGEF